jgi:hypothetical protein
MRNMVPCREVSRQPRYDTSARSGGVDPRLRDGQAPRELCRLPRSRLLRPATSRRNQGKNENTKGCSGSIFLSGEAAPNQVNFPMPSYDAESPVSKCSPESALEPACCQGSFSIGIDRATSEHFIGMLVAITGRRSSRPAAYAAKPVQQFHLYDACRHASVTAVSKPQLAQPATK